MGTRDRDANGTTLALVQQHLLAALGVLQAQALADAAHSQLVAADRVRADAGLLRVLDGDWRM